MTHTEPTSLRCWGRRSAARLSALHLPPALPVLLMLLTVATGCSAGGDGSGPGANQGPNQGQGQNQAPAVPVTVGRVTREAVPVEVHGIGTVASRSTVQVKAQVGGEITAVHFREGEDVKRGRTLFTIDPRPYRAAVQEAEARLERDRALAANAAQDVERYADLAKKDYVTQQQYEQIRTDAASKKATVAADEAALDRAKLELSWTTVTSPVTGRTGQLLVHAGNVVKANDAPLVVIQQIEPVDVSFSVDQTSLDEIRRRSAAGALTARAKTPGGTAHAGELTFIDNAVDPSTGTIRLKATFPNHDRALWPGQFVNVTLDLATEAGAVVAPAAAVQSGQQGDYVFVVGDDQTVASRSVRVSRTIGGKAVIASGLQPGETVVTDGQLRLAPGTKIEVKKGVGAAADAAAGEAGTNASDDDGGAPAGEGA